MYTQHSGNRKLQVHVPTQQCGQIVQDAYPNPGTVVSPGSTAENKIDHMFVEIKQYTLEQPVSQRKNLKYLETNKNGNTIYQNLQDAAKPVLTGKLIVMNTYIQKEKTSQIHNLTLFLKEPQKE